MVLCGAWQGQEAAVAKRQISLWSEREKGAFVDAYKALPSSLPPEPLFMPTYCSPSAS
jgi:hypothetical protein